MFNRRRIISGYKAVISLVLCTTLTLNTGCQSNSQKTQSLQKESIRLTSTEVKTQQESPMQTDLQKSPGQSNGLEKTVDGVYEFVGDAANFTGQIALVGAVVVGALFVDYQAWRLADKMF